MSFPERIAEILAEEIIERDLRPGDRLLEQTLAEQFGTSRAPIREALYLLTQEGLVERMPRRGTVVKTYPRREIEELYKVRYVLEELALERICDSPRMVRFSLAALEPIVDKMERLQKDLQRYHKLNFEFHEKLIVLSNSAVLSPLYAQIGGPLKIFLRLSIMTKGDTTVSLRDHKRLLAAIGEADLERAREILRNHDIDGMQRAIAVLESTNPADRL